MRQINARLMGLGIAAAMTGVGCSGGGSTTYSLLASGQSFKQATVSSKVDVLWVVDDSGSMLPVQQNLTSNFSSFMSQFIDKKFDFKVAVTSTAAYRAAPQFSNNPALAKFKDGAGANRSGIFVIDPTTPDLLNVFVMNASLGTSGSGDERAFSSFKQALDSDLNEGFLREDSFFAVVILSDEDDFSNPNRGVGDYTLGNHNYNNPGLESVDSYVSYLDGITNSSGATRRYSVSAITITDNACLSDYEIASPGVVIGARYIDLAEKTNGVLGSVCDVSFADSLNAIQQRIVELSTQFYLDGEPVPESIQVKVDGAVVAKNSTNGWTYNAPANSIVFHGSAVPASGADVSVSFDPASLNF